MQTRRETKRKSSTSDPVAVAALKAEVELELQNKKQCAYQPFECSQFTLDGYKYCAKHILQDKSAPFRQCSYVFAGNGKRCHLPAPKGDKKEHGYCAEHALKATLSRNKQNCKYTPPQSAEVLLQSLSHYIKKPRIRNASHQSEEGGRASPDDLLELRSARGLDPFNEIDAFGIHNNTCNNVLNYCSESESDVEPSSITSVWHDYEVDSSDNESIDSEQEDLLKHANIYTAEEITLITRDKLIRLQSLYIEQYRHLQHLLREKRRKYLHSLKREKESCCSIYNQVRDNPKEQRLYKKLKAYQRYHKNLGIDAILSKKLHERRAQITDGVAAKVQNIVKCSFTEGGVKCGERALPLAKHCRKHILEDQHQVLFRPCGKIRADVECTTPVEAIFDDTTCRLHADVPPIRSYSQHRKDSESDYDESLENSNLPPALDEMGESSLHAHIKSEMMQYVPEVPKMETLPSLLFEDSSTDKPESIEKQFKLDMADVKNESDSDVKPDYSKLGYDSKPGHVSKPGDGVKPGYVSNSGDASNSGYGSKPDDSKPDDSKPDDSKPDDSKPDDLKPSDSKPDDSKPDDLKPRDDDESGDVNMREDFKTECKTEPRETGLCGTKTNVEMDADVSNAVEQNDDSLQKAASFDKFVKEEIKMETDETSQEGLVDVE